MSSAKSNQRYDHVVVGAGLAGLMTALKAKGSTLVLESSEILGGRFASGLHIMAEASVLASPFLKITERLNPIKVRWDREWVAADQVDWADSAWKGVYLKTWDHYFGTDLCLVEFNQDQARAALESCELRFQEPVIELGAGDGEGAWVLKTPDSCISTNQITWCAGLTAFQNAVGKHQSQKFLGENELPTESAKDFRGGFAIDWVIPKSAFEGKTELCEAVASGGLFAIPVKHGGAYLLMILHLSVKNSELSVKSLTYVHEDLLRDPKESLTLQKSLKRGLKMLFVDQNAVDLQTSSEKLIVDQRLFGASSGLTWLLLSQPEIGLYFAGEESMIQGQIPSSKGLERAAETTV